ncbi:DUF2812 domain-containing protein [Paenibacillus sp. MMS20-IR301]|uniref:DUF2812 domain-containing protein n=1 Tax=Paenibacillus sp. MMS20-IR301 TaxID=2895946 RepID=UPI0028EFD6C0|nr:DUF2812 domain-containing protein [Paenibacillus sp. MMS20-IR301]WNS46065.1 DUF2812 domain-containing protein [Paenibacillus sp. MMS20-IR301]
MRKFKFFTNFDHEEHWLREMSRQGYRLSDKGTFSYTFVPAPPEDVLVKMDYRIFKKREDFEDYRALFEDSGWEHVLGTKRSGHQYFKAARKQRDEEIFSDVTSKASRYKRMAEMWAMLVLSFFPILIALILTNTIDLQIVTNPKLLYYTPGLWDMEGMSFWRAFLFETPFALFRGFLWLFLLIMFLLYLYFAYSANKQYKKAQKS